MERRRLLSLGAGALALGATGLPAHAGKVPGFAPDDQALAASLGVDFRSRYAEVEGVRLHYVIGGQGTPLLLLPGWPQTWWQYRKIMPALAKRHRVIAVDLPGQGGSSKPQSGYDKATMARQITTLVRKLGYQRVDVAGHDIGSMVAQSMAVHHAAAVRRLVLLDVIHPDESWYQFSLIPKPGETFHLWWFAFNQVRGLPETLLAGQSRELVDHMFDLMLADPRSIADRDRAIFAAAYGTADAVRAGNGWYQTFGQDIEDAKSHPILTLPVLGLISELSYPLVANVLATKAKDPRIVKVRNSGHFVAEEQPVTITTEMLRFLA